MKKGPFLVALIAAAPASAEEDAAVSAWLKARGQEQAAYLQREARAAQGQLWRERGAAEGIPNFVAPTSLSPLIKAVGPGVVHVTVAPLTKEGKRSLGSGFLISPDGFVVTNHHVVDRGGVKVRLEDGREFTADVVGRDASTDVALLRLRTDAKDLPYCFLGDSDSLEIGDWVVAIGNPFGLDHSVSHGMISAKERVIGIGPFDDFIQTDASINPGNSGGPLFNVKGEVVGVNTAIVTQGQGIGFAVPSNLLKDLLPQLRESGRLQRGWLGVNVVEAESEKKGAVVKDVFQGSPAAKVGLRTGDRILSVNGRPVESYQKLLRRIALVPPGTTLKLELSRGGKVGEVNVTLTERPAAEAMALVVRSAEGDALGLTVRDLQPAEVKAFGGSTGAYVEAVTPGGPAERAGIQVGDLITEVNRREVSGVKSYRAALPEMTAGGSLLRVQRGELARYVAIKVP